MRKINPRSFRHTIVVIVDGEDEKWYVEKLKEHYPCSALRTVGVKPEFPDKKQVDDLFACARTKVEEQFETVILILDMDNILKDSREWEKFKVYYSRYCDAQAGRLSPRQKAHYGWMMKLLLIVNAPCIEFWYMLHHLKTTKYYQDFLSLRADLKKLPRLDDYEKSEAYYKKSPNIYQRLGGVQGIQTACRNAEPFNVQAAFQQSFSEMSKFFDYFKL